MKRNWIIIMALLLTVTTTVKAQTGEVKMKIYYSAGFPAGSFKDFISDASYRGVGGSLLYGINDKISVGLEFNHQDFYQKYPRQLYKLSDGSDISAVVSNSVQTLPILLKGQYNFLPGKNIQPYAAVGIGGSFNSYRQFAGEFSDSQSKFGFAAHPEIGVFIPFGKTTTTGFSLGAGYEYNSFSYGNIRNFNHFVVNAGISFPLR